MAPLKVLVVDDSAIFSQKLAKLLTDIGHDVVGFATSGLEAVSKFEEVKPDIVTMDITMPDMDGIEATEILLRTHPSACIVMVTAQGNQTMVLRAVEAGAKGYLLKPLDRFKVVQTIDTVAKRYLM